MALRSWCLQCWRTVTVSSSSRITCVCFDTHLWTSQIPLRVWCTVSGRVASFSCSIFESSVEILACSRKKSTMSRSTRDGAVGRRGIGSPFEELQKRYCIVWLMFARSTWSSCLDCVLPVQPRSACAPSPAVCTLHLPHPTSGRIRFVFGGERPIELPRISYFILTYQLDYFRNYLKQWNLNYFQNVTS